tara:strand:+ start:2008 stop:2115 length:108 start_codon:yes stop_codon:yes gene_type:complete
LRHLAGALFQLAVEQELRDVFHEIGNELTNLRLAQ